MVGHVDFIVLFPHIPLYKLAFDMNTPTKLQYFG